MVLAINLWADLYLHLVLIVISLHIRANVLEKGLVRVVKVQQVNYNFIVCVERGVVAVRKYGVLQHKVGMLANPVQDFHTSTNEYPFVAV